MGLYFGKTDFWGFPGAVTYHASFEHFSVGYLLLGLVQTHGKRVQLNDFKAALQLANATMSAQVSGEGYSLAADLLVMSERNAIVANLSTTCPKGVSSVMLNGSLGSANLFQMPLAAGTARGEGGAHKTH